MPEILRLAAMQTQNTVSQNLGRWRCTGLTCLRSALIQPVKLVPIIV